MQLGVSGEILKAGIEGDALIGHIAHQPFFGSVYLVGGAVRELLLQNTPRDYDLALTDARDIGSLETLFQRPAFILGKKPIQTHRLVAGDTSIDITVIENTIEEDLKRRDFTMNAIAYDVHERRVIDILGGIEDIRNRIIRYPVKQSLANDPLRMLKAIRHYVTLKNFTFDRELVHSITTMKSLIKDIAAERVKYEMDHIVVADNVAEGFALLDETGLLFEIFPELFALRQMDIEKNFSLLTLGHTLDGFRFLHRFNSDVGLNDKELRNVAYAFLFHDLGKARTYSYDEQKGLVHFFHHERYSQEAAGAIMERLRFSLHEMKVVLALIESHMRIFLISNGESTEKAMRRIVYKMGELTPSLVAHTLCDLYGSAGGEENPSTELVRECCRNVLSVYEESLREPLQRLVSGDDLLMLGFSEGPLIGRCLNEIREKQIAGEMANRDDALFYAERFLKSEA